MPPQFQDDLLEQYSEAELGRFVRASPATANIGGVIFLSQKFIAKYYESEDALQDMRRAIETARQLGIQVPKIMRVISLGRKRLCVMERVHGLTLETAWRKMSWLSTLRTALQIRKWISLLGSITSKVAGSLATGRVRSFFPRRSVRPSCKSERRRYYVLHHVLGQFCRVCGRRSRKRTSKKRRTHTSPQYPNPLCSLIMTLLRGTS
jgi:hypothetical protein